MEERTEQHGPKYKSSGEDSGILMYRHRLDFWRLDNQEFIYLREEISRRGNSKMHAVQMKMDAVPSMCKHFTDSLLASKYIFLSEVQGSYRYLSQNFLKSREVAEPIFLSKRSRYALMSV